MLLAAIIGLDGTSERGRGMQAGCGRIVRDADWETGRDGAEAATGRVRGVEVGGGDGPGRRDGTVHRSPPTIDSPPAHGLHPCPPRSRRSRHPLELVVRELGAGDGGTAPRQLVGRGAIRIPVAAAQDAGSGWPTGAAKAAARTAESAPSTRPGTAGSNWAAAAAADGGGGSSSGWEAGQYERVMRQMESLEVGVGPIRRP